MTQRHELTLDMSIERTRNRMGRLSISGETRKLLKRYSLQGIALEVVRIDGGRAGVRIYGAKGQLELYVREIYCRGSADAQYYIDQIKEYTGAEA